MTTTPSLPHWDMSVVYPGLDSPEFAQAFEQCVQKIAQLSQLFDEHHIHMRERTGASPVPTQTLETVVQQYNVVLDLLQTVSTYISCFVDTNSYDTLAQARLSELQQHTVLLAQLGIRFTAWIGSLDVEALIKRSHIASEHAFVLRTMKEQATHLMTPAEEALAAELNVTGGSAWMKLH